MDVQIRWRVYDAAACSHDRQSGKKCSCAGTWEVRWREPKTRKRRSQSRKTFKEAKELKVSKEAELQTGTYRSPDEGQIPFSDFIDRWFAKQHHLAGSTRDRDASHIRTHLKPMWGSSQLADITIEEVEDWVIALDQNLARKTVLDIYGIFRRSMDYAVERKHLAHLPYPRTIRLPRDRGRPKQPTHIDNEADLWRLADSIVPIGEPGFLLPGTWVYVRESVTEFGG
jgi:hypothetical protein